MSLSVPYENLGDAQMRLQGTIVLYDGEPVYITDVREVGPGDPKGDIFRVYASPLPYDPGIRRAEEMRKFISSKKFDLAPFPMGFMNFQGNVFYCTRLARRQQRQGLSAGTLSALPVGNPTVGAHRFETLISVPEFLDCIKGRYPTVAEATRQIEEAGATGIAFSRSFCLVKDNDIPELIYLFHKKEKVGFIMEGRLMLSKKGKCLKESLNEVGVKC
jgi:hypothetical protein